MAIFVMGIIILLNVGLLILVMRIGTQEDHHSEFAADQSSAVIALHNKLGLPVPESKVKTKLQESTTVADDVDSAVAEIKQEIADAVQVAKDGLSETAEEVKEEILDESDND